MLLTTGTPRSCSRGSIAATLGIAAGLDEPPFGQTPLAYPLSIAIIVAVIAGSFVLGSLRLSRFEIKGGD